ncbi:ABC transporter [Knoellia aerolata DSM 18566]|uniref:ABC transporter n=2 Tax=Knoellia TaxID=136099 RepID=A0A0A0JWS8_9MICO|nr:ABC transporter [Knoellia aerolata DSM 18566]
MWSATWEGRLATMITVENLTKRYGSFSAVDDISFEVRPGSVVGFLGPNGAGKSTAMRMMTGLTPATSGRATVLGKAYRDLHNPGRQVGVMLDASAQHPGRTGREVLRLAAIQIGVPRSRVDEALALVGLTDEEAGRRVRNYSLGMRQRLGLASALLGQPEVLILDEPANGLDPQGIHWMRGLLRGFADGGGTVLLSSHLLHEVQVIADDLVMIGRGRIVARGTKDELLSRGGTTVRSSDDRGLRAALDRAGVTVTQTPAGLVVDAESGVVGRVALDERIVLLELRSGGSEGLEEMFLSLTASTSREGTAA